MKQGLIGFGLVLLVAAVGWLIAFGATAPCAAMGAEAKRLSEAPDTKSKAVGAMLAGPQGASLSALECAATAVRIKALGAGGVTVIGPGHGSAPTNERK